MTGLTRTDFVKASIAAGAGLALPLRTGALGAGTAAAAVGATTPVTLGLEPFVDALPVPPIWSGDELALRGLEMAESTHRFHRDLDPVPTWGYGGASYLGPTIHATVGEDVRFLARNRLGPHPLGVDTELHGPDMANDAEAPRVSLHLHGGYTCPHSDGYPEDTFTPGQDKMYHYFNAQQAGTTWYHDHALGITRLNVYAGLAGFYLMRDAAAEASLPGGAFEIPIAIQDKTFGLAGDGSLALHYPNPWEPEFFGDTAVVNGKAWPYLEVARGLYRFRLLNGSSSRIYNLFLEPGIPWFLIGTDTGFVERPVPLRNVVLAPGERADVVVDFQSRRAGDRVRLLNKPLPPHVVSPEEVAIPELVEFRVTGATGFRRGLPGRLAAPVKLPDRGVPERTVLLVEIMDTETDEPVMALLNNRPWETDEIERPVVDTAEKWNIVNLTADTHPIHLHLVQFRALWRRGFDAERYLTDVFGTDMLTPADVGTGTRPFADPAPYFAGPARKPERWEDGWKDTIQAHPGTVTQILVPFGPGAFSGVPFGFQGRVTPMPGHDCDHRIPFTGEYVWHCHILDHEDNEMMLPYEVVR